MDKDFGSRESLNRRDQILSALTDTPMTAAEISEKTGISLRGVIRQLLFMRSVVIESYRKVPRNARSISLYSRRP